MRPKFVAIVAASFVVTVLVYDLEVKRTNATRFLFGLRSLKKRRSDAPSARPKTA